MYVQLPHNRTIAIKYSTSSTILKQMTVKPDTGADLCQLDSSKDSIWPMYNRWLIMAIFIVLVYGVFRMYFSTGMMRRFWWLHRSIPLLTK